MRLGVFQSIVENSASLVLLVDEQGKILYTNRATENILGRSSQEMIGTSFFMLVPPEEQNQLWLLWRGCLSTPKTPNTLELRCSHSDGSPRVLELTLSNYLYDEGIGAVLIEAYDITKRTHNEERERDKQQEAITRLASKTAHDLKNALVTIFGFADLLRPNLPASSLEELDEIIFAGQRVALLVERLQLIAYPKESSE